MLYPIQENKLHGFINNDGDIIVKPKYSFAGEFSEEMCCVCLTGNAKSEKDKFSNIILSGFIDSHGIEVVSPKYIGFGLGLRYREGLTMVKFPIEWKWGFINKNGEIMISPKYDQEYSKGFCEGFADVAIGEKWGFINKNDEVVIPFEYDWTNQFQNGFAIVKQKNKKFFINTKGEVLKTIKCNIIDTVIGGFKEGLAVVKIDKKYGFINFEGQLENQELFDEAWGFHEGLSAVKKDGKYGYINFKGEFVIPPQFELARPHINGIATFSEKGKWGLIDKFGNIIKMPSFDYIDHFGAYLGDLSQIVERNLTRALIGKEDYYIDRKGEIVAKKTRNVNEINNKIFLNETKFVRIEVWDKGKWHLDEKSKPKKSAIRHIYFVLKWLKNKKMLTEEGLNIEKIKNNFDVELNRNLVTNIGADFLDRYYKKWFKNENIINFQIDSDLKFIEDEGLNSYWEEYLKLASNPVDQQKSIKKWWQKFFNI